MAQYYSISFTTLVLVTKYDSKGKPMAATRLDKPVTLIMLPHQTAMAYSGCDNFKIEPYVMEPRRSANNTGRDKSVGNGTKKVSHYDRSAGVKIGKEVNAISSGVKTGRSKVAEAAATGNMAAALNE